MEGPTDGQTDRRTDNISLTRYGQGVKTASNIWQLYRNGITYQGVFGHKKDTTYLLVSTIKQFVELGNVEGIHGWLEQQETIHYVIHVLSWKTHLKKIMLVSMQGQHKATAE